MCIGYKYCISLDFQIDFFLFRRSFHVKLPMRKRSFPNVPSSTHNGLKQSHQRYFGIFLAAYAHSSCHFCSLCAPRSANICLSTGHFLFLSSLTERRAGRSLGRVQGRLEKLSLPEVPGSSSAAEIKTAPSPPRRKLQPRRVRGALRREKRESGSSMDSEAPISPSEAGAAPEDSSSSAPALCLCRPRDSADSSAAPDPSLPPLAPIDDWMIECDVCHSWEGESQAREETSGDWIR